MILNSYNNTEAENWRKQAGDLLADQDLAERVYTSRLIGKNPDLLMHGGGNTSVKINETNLNFVIKIISPKIDINRFFGDENPEKIIL